MNECRNCRWWNQHSASGVGVCQRMSSKPILGIERHAQAIADHQNDSASVLTLADFGCVDFEEKELEETTP